MYTLQPIQIPMRFVPFFTEVKHDYLPDLSILTTTLKVDIRHFFAKELMNLRSTQATIVASQHTERIRVRVKTVKPRRILHIPTTTYIVSDSNSSAIILPNLLRASSSLSSDLGVSPSLMFITQGPIQAV